MSEKTALGGQVGVVTQVDAARAKVRCKLPEKDGVETFWLGVITSFTARNKDYALPDPGDQVVCLLDEQSQNGFVIGAVYSEADTPPVTSADKRHVRFSDGTTVEYNRSSHVLAIKVAAGGKVNIEAAAEVTLKAPTIRLDGVLSANTSAGSSGNSLTLRGSIIDLNP